MHPYIQSSLFCLEQPTRSFDCNATDGDELEQHTGFDPEGSPTLSSLSPPSSPPPLSPPYSPPSSPNQQHAAPRDVASTSQGAGTNIVEATSEMTMTPSAGDQHGTPSVTTSIDGSGTADVKKFTDPTPDMGQQDDVDATSNKVGTCTACLCIEVLLKEVVILKTGTECGWAGRKNALHVMCTPMKLTVFARCLYDLRGNDGFTLKRKDGQEYVELQLDDVEWAKWGIAC